MPLRATAMDITSIDGYRGGCNLRRVEHGPQTDLLVHIYTSALGGHHRGVLESI